MCESSFEHQCASDSVQGFACTHQSADMRHGVAGSRLVLQHVIGDPISVFLGLNEGTNLGAVWDVKLGNECLAHGCPVVVIKTHELSFEVIQLVIRQVG